MQEQTTTLANLQALQARFATPTTAQRPNLAKLERAGRSIKGTALPHLYGMDKLRRRQWLMQYLEKRLGLKQSRKELTTLVVLAEAANAAAKQDIVNKHYYYDLKTALLQQIVEYYPQNCEKRFSIGMTELVVIDPLFYGVTSFHIPELSYHTLAVKVSLRRFHGLRRQAVIFKLAQANWAGLAEQRDYSLLVQRANEQPAWLAELNAQLERLDGGEVLTTDG